MGVAAFDFKVEWSRALDVTGARVSEIQYRPDQACPEHWHERPSLGIVLTGEITKEIQKTAVVISTNHGYTLPPGMLHSDRFSPGSRVVIIELDPVHDLTKDRLRLCGDVFERLHRIEDQRLARLGYRLASELRKADPATPLAVDGIIGEALSITARCANDPIQSGIPGWLNQAREIARTNLNRRVAVAEIAEEVGVHPAYLARRFREVYGVTPAVYGRNVRLQWAAERLISTEIPIAEIAIQAGFSDQSHFTRAFRQFIDQTPAQYRESYLHRGRG